MLLLRTPPHRSVEGLLSEGFDYLILEALDRADSREFLHNYLGARDESPLLHRDLPPRYLADHFPQWANGARGHQPPLGGINPRRRRTASN